MNMQSMQLHNGMSYFWCFLMDVAGQIETRRSPA